MEILIPLAIVGGWVVLILAAKAKGRRRLVGGVLLAVPVLAIACFQFDGIYIGVTRTVDMRNMMIVSTAIYLAAWWGLSGLYGNHGLWAALMVFFVIRGLTLGWRYPALVRATFPS